MPGYTWSTPDLERVGPVIGISVAVPAALEAALRDRGQPVPTPVTVRALIDTGAGVSAISRETARHLGIQQGGTRLISTPTVAAKALPEYEVRLLLPGGVTREAWVVEAQIDGHASTAMIGRDVLAHAVLIYNGSAGHCTIVF